MVLGMGMEFQVTGPGPMLETARFSHLFRLKRGTFMRPCRASVECRERDG